MRSVLDGDGGGRGVTARGLGEVVGSWGSAAILRKYGRSQELAVGRRAGDYYNRREQGRWPCVSRARRG
jgi:hypothetical protein